MKNIFLQMPLKQRAKPAEYISTESIIFALGEKRVCLFANTY